MEYARVMTSLCLFSRSLTMLSSQLTALPMQCRIFRTGVCAEKEAWQQMLGSADPVRAGEIAQKSDHVG